METDRSTYEAQFLEEMRGTPQEYLPNLLQIIRLYRESVSLKPAEASFRQGWKEARMKQTFPVSELWKGIEAE